MLVPSICGALARRWHARRSDDGWRSGTDRRSVRARSGEDRRLEANEEPPVGAHLVTPRFGYLHHGVYVGCGRVVHYAAFAYQWRRGPVEEVSLSRFAHGHSIWVRPAGPDGLRLEEIVRRARSRLGESRYRLLSNNCEHLAEWSVRGRHRSRQAEHFLLPISWLSREFSALCRLMRLSITVVRRNHRWHGYALIASTPLSNEAEA